MSLSTYSKFYYGHNVTNENQYIDIDEGAGEIAVKVPVGSYTLTKFTEVVAQALNAAGANTYTVSVDRATRIITIGVDAATDFLGATGANVSRSLYSLLGLNAADDLATTSLVGDFASGLAYAPSFILQDHVPSEKSFKALSATVSKSASGSKLSVQTFGEERFLKCNAKYITNIAQPAGSRLRSNTNAVQEALDFLNYATTKAPIEFMANENAPGTFEKLILESTASQSDGTGYELKEYYDKKLPGYFETGLLTFKVIEE
jgi:hypothetical protein